MDAGSSAALSAWSLVQVGHAVQAVDRRTHRDASGGDHQVGPAVAGAVDLEATDTALLGALPTFRLGPAALSWCR